MRALSITCAVFAAALVPPVHASAQTPPSSAAPTVVTASRTPVEVLSGQAHYAGSYSAANKLRVVIGLRPPRPEEERQFLDALYTEGNAQYRHFLTSQQWIDRFAPSAADEQAVVDWANAHGLNVTGRYPNRLLVDVEAPVAQLQQAFSVNINRYLLNGAAVFSNDRDPVIPAELSHAVLSVLGLNSIQTMHPHARNARPLVHPDYVEGPLVALAGEARGNGDASKLAATKAASTPAPAFQNGFYDPSNIYSSQAYNYDALQHLGHCCNPNHVASGSPPETSIAIATAGAQQLSDMQGFHNTFPYLAYNITYFNIDGTPTCCDGEGTMDAEWSTAMSNSFGAFQDTAHVYVYQGVNNLLSTFSDIYNRMLTDGHARVMTVSWGCAEFTCATDGLMDSQNAIFNAMSAQGWTLVADADDKGATADCLHTLVEFPASSPNIVAAGGTELHLNSDGTYSHEIAWTGDTFTGACNENRGGGGGGFSSKFAAPSYQAFLGHGVRTLPDVSLNANFAETAQAIFFAGHISGNGGTSIVAPELAGFFAQENAYLLHLENIIGNRCFGNNACAPIGNANYYIYLEQQHAPNYAQHYPFYDITSGCNSNDVTAAHTNDNFFCAAPGYDETTGLGSANMLQLAWAINFSAAGDFGPPEAQFSGATVNTWYNTPKTINVQFSDTTQNSAAPNGIAGLTLGWDNDPAPESFSRSTPGSGDAFYSGPAIVNATSGNLSLANAGQGCHTAKAKAWDNTGMSSGLLSYGPVCYDTIAPVTTAVLSGASSGGVYTTPVKVTLMATDGGSGVAARFFAIDNGGFLAYGSPFTVSASGTHTLRFFSRDVAGNSETVHTLPFSIKLSATKTALTSSRNPSTYGLGVTFTARVTPVSGNSTPTGTVTFKDGAAVLGTASLSNGSAGLTTTSLAAGSHAISAIYSGGSVSPVFTETVNKEPTTAVIASSLNPDVYGKPVTFAATITPLYTHAIGGTVTFKDGAVSIGSAAVDSSTNRASLTVPDFAAGLHALTAVYNGSVNRAVSTSGVLHETVNKEPTTTAIVSSLNPDVYGKPVTITASVKPLYTHTIGGTVTFKDGTATIATIAVDSATNGAAVTVPKFAAGVHMLTAIYNGSINRTVSTSAVLHETVDKEPTSTMLVSSVNPSTFGKTVTFTATVIPEITHSIGGTVSGSVTFRAGATVIGTAVINSATGKAALSTSALSVAVHHITAVYEGSVNRVGSTSPVLIQTVKSASDDTI